MSQKQLDWRSTRAKLDKIQALLRDLADLGDFDLERMRRDRIAGLAAERVLTLLVDLRQRSIATSARPSSDVSRTPTRIRFYWRPRPER